MFEALVPFKRRVQWVERTGRNTDHGVVGADYVNIGGDYVNLGETDYNSNGDLLQKSFKRKSFDRAVDKVQDVNYLGLLRTFSGLGGIWLTNEIYNAGAVYLPTMPGILDVFIHYGSYMAGMYGGYKASYLVQNGVHTAVAEMRKKLLLG